MNNTSNIVLRTENTQTTISALNFDFAGRRGANDYDPSKQIHIHRRNRPFVWNTSMQQKLLDSILKGYYIPPIICSSMIDNNTEHRFVMEGGNRITTFRYILNNHVRQLTNEEKCKVEAFPITLVVMRNLTSQQQREMFRRLNKNVNVSDGQLYAMSEEDSLLVQEAMALLEDDNYPIRELLVNHFGELKGKDTDSKGILANAVGIVSGIIYGPKFLTKLYNVQEEKIEIKDTINRQMIITMLGNALEIFSIADQKIPVHPKNKRGQFTIGKYIGAILYDLHTHPGETRKIQHKWSEYIIKVRNGEQYAEDAVKIKGAQNLNPDKLKRISESVRIYLSENRIATQEELKILHHERDDNHTTDDEDDDENIAINDI